MEMVFQSTDVNDAHIVQSLLETNGIESVVKNDLTQALSGEMAFSSAWPEVWIADDSDFARAKELIDNRELAPPSTSTWTCPKCGEKIEGEFDACWKCGTLRDGSSVGVAPTE